MPRSRVRSFVRFVIPEWMFERVKAEGRLRRLRMHDLLHRLPNRRAGQYSQASSSLKQRPLLLLVLVLVLVLLLPLLHDIGHLLQHPKLFLLAHL